MLNPENPFGLADRSQVDQQPTPPASWRGGSPQAYILPMTFRDRFTARSVTGALVRAGVACVSITPVVAVAKVWWSGPAAAAIGILAIAVYVLAATRYMRRSKPR